MVSSSKLLRGSVKAGLSLPLAAVAFALVGPVSAANVFAQDAAPVVTPGAVPMGGQAAATSEMDPAVRKSADDFWHYATIARYELATAEAEKLSAGDPYAVYRAFWAVAQERNADLDATLNRWKNVEPLKASVTKLQATLDKGRLTLREDQAYIESNLKRLITNERSYQLAVERLRASGELAVPQMINWLRDPNQAQYHGAIRRALTDMGKAALSPLLAATEAKDPRVTTTVATVLGDMGYDTAAPYLLKLSAAPDASSSVRAAASSALGRLGAAKNATAAQAFYDLAEKFYYEKAMITAAGSGTNMAYVWMWDEGKGLTKVDVPPAIFNEVMAMKCAEQALTLDRGMEQALSLWLAANYKREAELPADAKDLTRMEGSGDANYYGVTAGARYLNDVLFRALRDQNSAVALKAVKSLQQIVGTASLFQNGASTPLTQALSYPDRQVRFEAAYTVGSSMPSQPFAGSNQVVPTLAEMISQTGKPGVLVVAKTDADVAKWSDALKAQGYNVVGGTTAEAALGMSTQIPSVDVVVISEEAGLGAVDTILASAASSPKVGLAPKIIITKTPSSTYAGRAATDPLVNLTQSTDPSALKAEIDKATARAGSNALSEGAASDSAKRALTLLKNLAVSKTTTLDLSAAKPAVLTALDDSRADIAMLAGEVLAWIGGKEGQGALAAKATAEGTSPEMKISALHSLAASAKMWGNQLTTEAVEGLEKLVTGSESMELRTAAAEARGALNLPADEAKGLILKTSAPMAAPATPK